MTEEKKPGEIQSRNIEKKEPAFQLGKRVFVAAAESLQSVRGAPVEFFLGLCGDRRIGVIVASATAAGMARGAVSDHGSSRNRNFALEAGAERAGGRSDAVDEPDRMQSGARMHDDLMYRLVKNDSGQKKTAPEDG